MTDTLDERMIRRKAQRAVRSTFRTIHCLLLVATGAGLMHAIEVHEWTGAGMLVIAVCWFVTKEWK